ncbi:MAG: trypsin-like peptidase domain-containing protein [Opitutae bacterium]|nr:trypsin-like peptidase domain-containing protein [Opitutae bacterium]
MCRFSSTILIFLTFLTSVSLLAERRYFNDLKLGSDFQKGLEKLLDGNQSVSLSDLKKQLTQKHSKVVLGEIPIHSAPSNKLYDHICKSVLVMGRLYNCGKCSKWHTSMASAFVIGQDGIIETNHHVLAKDEAEILGAMDNEGTIYAVEKVLAANQQDDLAILKLRDAKLIPMSLAKPANVGSDVWVISHPNRKLYTMTKGMVSRYHMILNNDRKPGRRMAITADYAKGSSGAPVFNRKGQVVGVVSSTSSIYYSVENGKKENLQMVVKNCIPVESIHELIQK